MVREVTDLLEPGRGGVFVDGTLGGGGHSEAILNLLPKNGRLIGIDRDETALKAASTRLRSFGDRFTALHGNFFHMKSLLLQKGVMGADGILLDLGVSSYQLDEKGRGFSYTAEAPLDMRMDQSAAFCAKDVVNGYSEAELIRVIRDYGEEKFAARVARIICERRAEKPIETTSELADIVYQAIPAAARHKENQHPARRTFQAIRIEVNGELDSIPPSLEEAIRRLAPGGRAAVITFHSLEDRITKQTFTNLASGCTCPPNFPVCVCGKKPTVKILNKKPILPSEEEMEVNPRSRSAKLRGAEKL
jgi:16S rRNA (cytosine1402-N4)-methyltransferase